MKIALFFAAPLSAWLVACSGSSSSHSGGSSPMDRACTDIGCVDGLHVALDPSSGWPPGHYVFRAEADGYAQTCEGDLPLPACEAGRALHCSGPELVRIGESGCALPPAQHGFASLDFNGLPKQVRVTVKKDDTSLADQSFAPAYKTSRPNGPQCEPVCTSASERISIRF